MASPEIAVFGAGLVGARHVKEAAKQARLCAIADPGDGAKKLAQEYGVPYFSDPADCLAGLKPDGVVIATPNHLHADHAVICVERGIPCLIEKPIADNIENANRIVDAGQAHGVPILVGHHRRHNPIIRRAREIISSGELGEIVSVTAQFWLYKPDDYFEASWRKLPGAGPLLINCIHDFDLLRHLCGEIVQVETLLSNRMRAGEVEDTAAILLRFENGALGTVAVSDTIVAPWSWEMTSAENPVYPHLSQSCYRIGGNRKSLSLPDLTIWSHTGERSWWSPMETRTAQVEPSDAFSNQFTHFCDVISGAEPLVSAAEGRASLAATLRCLG